MKVYLAADHAGYKLKGKLKEYLEELGYEVEDMGAYGERPEDDYPDFVIPAAEKVASDLGSRGIMLGGSGQGEDIAADKVKGIRGVLYYGGAMEVVRLSRAHNDANVLSLGARFLSVPQAKEAVKLWLETPFEGGRHERRLKKIALYEDTH